MLRCFYYTFFTRLKAEGDMLTSQEVSMPKSVDVTEYAFVQTRLEH